MSRIREVIVAVWDRKSGRALLILLLALYVCAIAAPFIAPYETSTQELGKAFHPPTSLTFSEGRLAVRIYQQTNKDLNLFEPIEGKIAPIHFFSRGYEYKILGILPWDRHLFTVDEAHRIYLLGSDSTGRDVFSRLLYGSQISLSIGLIGISITLFFGFIVGAVAGFYGGKTDFVIMRLVEILMAIPGLYLLLALRSALAPYFSSTKMYLVIVIILALIGWAGTSRMIRGMALSIRNRPFVQASEAMGQSTTVILFRHILPNLSSYLLVAATLSIPGYILGEAALSFLGLGITEPDASWGLMLSQAQEARILMLNFWWMLTPGVAIFITVMAFNLLGDILRDIVDPKFGINKS
ncbi:MAG: ABC transporter permease [Verrucomicrobiota bacterium]